LAAVPVLGWVRAPGSGRARGRLATAFQFLQALVDLGTPGQDRRLSAGGAGHGRENGQDDDRSLEAVGHEGADKAHQRQAGGDDLVHLVGREGHAGGGDEGDEASPR